MTRLNNLRVLIQHPHEEEVVWQQHISDILVQEKDPGVPECSVNTCPENVLDLKTGSGHCVVFEKHKKSISSILDRDLSFALTSAHLTACSECEHFETIQTPLRTTLLFNCVFWPLLIIQHNNLFVCGFGSDQTKELNVKKVQKRLYLIKSGLNLYFIFFVKGLLLSVMPLAAESVTVA